MYAHLSVFDELIQCVSRPMHLFAYVCVHVYVFELVDVRSVRAQLRRFKETNRKWLYILIF